MRDRNYVITWETSGAKMPRMIPRAKVSSIFIRPIISRTPTKGDSEELLMFPFWNL